jgi:serine/threonine-protein kinase RsbW
MSRALATTVLVSGPAPWTGFVSSVIAATILNLYHGRPMMTVVIPSRLPDIRRAIDLADEFRDRHRLPERDADAVNVMLDELLTNSIRHGLRGSGDHEIAVKLHCADGEIVVEIEDDGVAFDPTKAGTPDTRGSLAERKVGGLGIAFVRSLADSFEYQRVNGRNHVILRRRIRREGEP